MVEIHILNCGEGDCHIIKHNSGHITVIDICNGNLEKVDESRGIVALEKMAAKGNFGMCKHPTNPLDFLKDKLNAKSVFRFILTHPDMDHMDGIDNLMRTVPATNFWDSGVRKEKPDFSDRNNRFKEEDWGRYENIISGNEDITVISPLAGSRNRFFNRGEDGEGGGDGLWICSPNVQQISDANDSGSAEAINDASYVVTYRTAGCKIVFSGDSHDKAWESILEGYKDAVEDATVLLAPHHGRESNRSWDFLDVVKPKFSVFGCAPSEHLAYAPWNNRGLGKVTKNQTGNIAMYPHDSGIKVYVENDSYAQRAGGNVAIQDSYGNYFLKDVSN